MIGTYAGRVSLYSVGGLSLAATLLIVGSLLAEIGSVLAMTSVKSDAEAFLAGELDEDEWLNSFGAAGLVGMLQVALFVAAIVVTIIWLYRLVANHRSIGRKGTWGPGWAIGGWFLLPKVAVIPALTLTEAWKASTPDPNADWKRTSGNPLVWVWFVMWTVVPLALMFSGTGPSIGSQFSTDAESVAEMVVDGQTSMILGTASNVIAGALFVLLVRQLTTRHRQLTGN